MHTRFFTAMSSALIALSAFAGITLAHGTMQKIVEGKYLVNLSSAPISPYAGQEQQSIIALSDVATNSLIEKDSVFTVEVRRDGTTLHSEKNLVATGGLLQFRYVYPEPGMYELFMSFTLPGSDHVYEPEDYWVQVIPKPVSVTEHPGHASSRGAVIVGVIAALLGYFFGRRERARS